MCTYPNSSGVDGTWVKLIKAQIPFKTAGMIRHLRYTCSNFQDSVQSVYAYEVECCVGSVRCGVV